MNKILANLALIDLCNFCGQNGIRISGTHLHKIGRGFTFGLFEAGGKRELVATVTFHKAQVPTHSFNSKFKK